MNIRVMIADDHGVFRSGLRALLEKEADIEVVGETATGPDTLQMAADMDFDVLILDISMPGMSGAKVARKLLDERPTLAILVLTMHEDERYVREFLGAGVRGYMLKKSSGVELVQAIRAVYAGKSYVDTDLVDLIISPYVGKPPPEGKKGSDRLSLLSPREQEVCRLLAQGYSHAKAAGQLNISPRTVETHRANIMNKLGLKSRVDLVHFAIDNDLLKTT